MSRHEADEMQEQMNHVKGRCLTSADIVDLMSYAGIGRL
jgi:hemolysin activation/secretion protein